MAGDRSHAAGESLSEDVFRNRLVELPPSVKLVVKVLEDDAPLTQPQLVHETLLPKRTVRYALNRLDDAGLITTKHDVYDARRRVYTLRKPQDNQ